MARWLGYLLFLIALAGLLYVDRPERWVRDNVWCAFSAKAGNAPRRFGKLGEAIGAVRIVGRAERSSEPTLYDFKGRATIMTSTRSVDGPVDGDVFVEKPGTLQGLVLHVRNGAFGEDGLEVTTLNRDGMLDFSETEAFLHVGENLGVANRLSYPVAMACRASVPPRLAGKAWSWLPF